MVTRVELSAPPRKRARSCRSSPSRCRRGSGTWASSSSRSCSSSATASATSQGSAGDVDTGPPTLDNYGDALSATFFQVLRPTLRIAIIGTVLCLLIGFPLAYFIAVRCLRAGAGSCSGS